MDFMGFYMRKRSRERKTPRVFDKLNNHKRLTNSDKVIPKEGKFVPFRPSYYNPGFWVFMIIFASALIWLISSNRLNPSLFGRLIVDDNQHLKTFYQERKTGIDSLFQFLKNREGRLVGIGFDGDSITLNIRSEDYEEIKGDQPYILRHRNSTDFHAEQEPEIIDGALRVDTYGYHRLYSNFWSYDLKVARLRDINTTIIAHLETSYIELHGILTILSREHFKIKYASNEIALAFKFDSHYYEIISNDSITNPQEASLIPLETSIYIQKKTRFSHLFDE